MSTTISRPEYVNVVTPSPTVAMPDDCHEVLILGRETHGLVSGPEIVAQCQELGSPEIYNWLIDTDGVIYELTGWDRVSQDGERFVIGVVDGVTPEQHRAVTWLVGQLVRKKKIDIVEVAGLPGFTWGSRSLVEEGK